MTRQPPHPSSPTRGEGPQGRIDTRKPPRAALPAGASSPLVGEDGWGGAAAEGRTA